MHRTGPKSGIFRHTKSIRLGSDDASRLLKLHAAGKTDLFTIA